MLWCAVGGGKLVGRGKTRFGLTGESASGNCLLWGIKCGEGEAGGYGLWPWSLAELVRAAEANLERRLPPLSLRCRGETPRAVSFLFVMREHDKQDARARHTFKKQGPAIREQCM